MLADPRDPRAFNVRALAQALVFALPPGWKISAEEGSTDTFFRAYLSKEGARLHLYRHQGESRLTIAAEFPDNYRPYPNPYRITVDPNKPAKSIAGDIERRVLKEYLPALAQTLETKAKHDVAKEKTRKLVSACAKAFGVTDPTRPNDQGRGGPSGRGTTEEWTLHIGYGYLKFSSYKPDVVDFERVTIHGDLVLKFAALVKKPRKTRKTA